MTRPPMSGTVSSPHGIRQLRPMTNNGREIRCAHAKSLVPDLHSRNTLRCVGPNQSIVLDKFKCPARGAEDTSRRNELENAESMMILCWSITCKTPTCGTQHLIAEAISPPDAALDFLCDDCGQQYVYTEEDYRPMAFAASPKGFRLLRYSQAWRWPWGREKSKGMTRPLIPRPTILFELDICDAIDDHLRCPGYSILHAGDLLLGPVACICHCHPKTKTITH